jgi:hypothetical protein
MPFTGHRSRLRSGLVTLQGHASGLRLRVTPGLPRDACGAARLPLVSAGTRDARVLSREDCHPWARSPFTRLPFKTLGTALLWTVAAYRLLQTRFDVRARPSSADILARIRPPFPSRSLTFFCVGGFSHLRRGGHPRRARKIREPFGADGVERRTRAWRECPSSIPRRASFVANPLLRKIWSLFRRAALPFPF